MLTEEQYPVRSHDLQVLIDDMDGLAEGSALTVGLVRTLRKMRVAYSDAQIRFRKDASLEEVTAAAAQILTDLVGQEELPEKIGAFGAARMWLNREEGQSPDLHPHVTRRLRLFDVIRSFHDQGWRQEFPLKTENPFTPAIDTILHKRPDLRY